MDAPVTLILLAAGLSSRMRGADKMCEPVAGRPLLRVMAGRCLAAGPVRVVLGPGQPARRALLRGLDLEIVEAAGDDGMAASLRAGVDGLRAAGALVVLADMPEVAAADLTCLADRFAEHPDRILRGAAEDGTPGHPVVFPADLFGEIAALRGDRGAREVLDRHRDRIRLVRLPGRRALTDLDTPEAWAAWRAEQGLAD